MPPLRSTTASPKSDSQRLRLHSDTSQRTIGLSNGMVQRVMAPPETGKDVRLDNVFSCGDIIVARSNGCMLQIGAMGGHFGHVMVVTAEATCIQSGTVKAMELQGVWPKQETHIWSVPVVESTRGVEGLRETTLLVCPDRTNGTIKVIADLSSDDELCQCDEDDVIEVWQSPTQLRDLLNLCQSRSNIMEETFAEIRKLLGNANWSEMTAVRAALMPAALDSNLYGVQALAQVQSSWSTPPICTSVAIIFWQRLLCKLAVCSNRGSDPEASMAMIQRWMPVRADRSLPGDLCEALLNSGWIKTARANHLRVKL